MKRYIVGKEALSGVRLQMLECKIIENTMPNGTKSSRAKFTLSDGVSASHCTSITSLNDVRGWGWGGVGRSQSGRSEARRAHGAG